LLTNRGGINNIKEPKEEFTMRIKKRFVLAPFIIAGLLVGVIAWAGDVLDFFEIGDQVINPGTADILGTGACNGNVPDWETLFNADGSLKDIAPANGIPDAKDCGGITAVFIGINDDFPVVRPGDDLAVGKDTDDTIFASSNKNNDPVSTWRWDTGNVPVKDDISNAYAYATFDDTPTTSPDVPHLIIYTGLERLSPGGASHVDFEFNQAGVGLDKGVPCGDDESAGQTDDPPCEFTGEKTVGDILVVMWKARFRRGKEVASSRPPHHSGNI
jgi:hypothetical protein